MKNYRSAFVQTTYLTTTALSLAAFVTPSCARSEEDAVRATPVVSFVAARADQKIITFDAPFLFTYLAWENKAKIENNKAYLNAPGMTPQGGGGYCLSARKKARRRRMIFRFRQRRRTIL